MSTLQVCFHLPDILNLLGVWISIAGLVSRNHVQIVGLTWGETRRSPSVFGDELDVPDCIVCIGKYADTGLLQLVVTTRSRLHESMIHLWMPSTLETYWLIAIINRCTACLGQALIFPCWFARLTIAGFLEYRSCKGFPSISDKLHAASAKVCYFFCTSFRCAWNVWAAVIILTVAYLPLVTKAKTVCKIQWILHGVQCRCLWFASMWDI